MSINSKLLFVVFVLFIFSVSYSEYYSQSGQDKYLNEVVFKGKRNGFFVEIGANTGIKFSNSYFFEKNLAWNGICIEANPNLFPFLQRNRKCICVEGAISNVSGIQKFVCHPVSWVSGLLDSYNDQHRKKHNVDNLINTQKAQVIDVECFLLNDVLAKYDVRKIDFISLDVEGGELEILKSIDYENYDIKAIVVENIYLDPTYEVFMKSKGYRLVKRLERDQFFLKN